MLNLNSRTFYFLCKTISLSLIGNDAMNISHETNYFFIKVRWIKIVMKAAHLLFISNKNTLF